MTEPDPPRPDDTPAPDPKRLVEALLFASAEPIEEGELQARLGGRADVAGVLALLAADYAGRGVQLERHGRGWAFRTAVDLAPHLVRVERRSRGLSRAALETLAVIAYQQPVTRAEIEAVRGVAVGAGTLDQLVEAGWVKPAGRRDTPGRPVTWVTTPAFLDQFDLGALDDLPRLDELEGAALFNAAGGS
jgi:segregation and condensation protein B